MALEKKSSELTTWNSKLECWEGWEGTINRTFARQWCDENGYLHREGAPAYIEYREDGTPFRESWWLHGERHREGAPAEIWYYTDGTPSDERWYLHGELHREGAPAAIEYLEDGTPIHAEWWLHGDDSGDDSTPLYSHETLVALVTLLGIEGFRTHGSTFGFIASLGPDLDSLLK